MACLAVMISAGMVSCDDDDFTESIFDTTDYPLDQTSYSFPLDTFCKVHFLEPYNMRYLYKMEDIGSDMDYNLVPCSYDNSITLAVLCEYLWFEVYKNEVGELFLKNYSPKIIHVIGSPAYNPSSGTEVLGTAEGGLKITLYNANNLDITDIDDLNEKFFKTMHHEFSHILNQNVNRPTDFDLISNGKYNVMTWQDTPDSVALGQGFVSPYASSQASEDWVEVIANYIVKDTLTWNQMLNSAEYEWETVDEYDASSFDKAVAAGADRDTLGYFVEVSSYSTSGTASTYTIQRKKVSRDDTGTAIESSDGGWTYLDEDGVNGRSVILEKLEYCRDWLETYFDYDLEAMRTGVQKRQWVTDENDDYVFEDGYFINAFTYPVSDGVTTLIDSLRNEVLKYAVE